MNDSTIHDLDLALWITGSPVKTIYVHGQSFDKGIAALEDRDLVVVTLEHANGAVTVIDNGRRCSYGYDQRLEVTSFNFLISILNSFRWLSGVEYESIRLRRISSQIITDT